MRPTLWQEFEHSFAVHTERIAVRMDETTLTYADLERWSRTVAALLEKAGIRPGDPVAIYTRNRIEFLVADVAIARLGAVKVPINFMLNADTAGYILERSGARALVVDDVQFDAALTDYVEVIVFCSSGNTALPSGALEFPGREYDLPDGAAVPAAGTSEAPAAIYFTGGTTGRPKGVLHTQASTVALHYAQLLEAEITDSDRLLLMTPLAHAAGLFAQSALIRGSQIVLTEKFDARQAIELMALEEITWTFLVPTMIYRLLDLLAEDDRRLPGLRTIVYGAAPITPTRLRQAIDRFGPVFVQLYGQTESPNWGTRLTKADHDPERPELLASCGRASIMAAVKIVDEAGETLGADRIGEICLRTPYLLKEYVGDPEATAAKFLGGWIRTGDIGVMDAAGYVYLKDRKNDMVISGGMNVYCREVEDVLMRHEAVAAVAVIGIPHDDWGESVHACVVRGDTDLSAEALISWARPLLAAYSTPKSVEFVTELPETAFGKIDKRALRARHWQGRDRGIG